MKETTTPKYQLLKEKANHQRSFGSLNRKTTFIQRNNSSSDFSRTQLFDYKKIEQFKSTIQAIVQRISLQNKRNHVLKNLVQMMNQQMIFIRQQSKKNEHQQFEQQSKVIKKLNYDIDKILQKNNQQIANLFRLKEEINAKRSQRVVFSNLFRKIQTQLKNATNLYIQTIIKSETSKYETINLQLLAPNANVLEQTPMTERNLLKESQQASEERNFIHRNSQNRARSESSQMRKRKFKPQKGVGSRFITQHLDNYDHSQHIQKKMSLINNEIYHFEFEIKRLFQFTGCEDYWEAQAFVNNVQSENERLQQQLQEISKQVQEIEFEQRAIINQRKNAQIVEQPVLSKSKKKIKNLNSKSTKLIQTEKQPLVTNHEVVEQLLHIFNLHDESTDRFNENVSLMDQKLDMLLKMIPSSITTNNNSVSEREKLEKETNLSSSGSEKQALPPLNVILDRVQPIGDSEKLYEKSWFLDAYQRELKKFNKKEHKKK